MIAEMPLAFFSSMLANRTQIRAFLVVARGGVTWCWKLLPDYHLKLVAAAAVSSAARASRPCMVSSYSSRVDIEIYTAKWNI